MNFLTRNLISLALLAALASCTAKTQPDPANLAQPASPTSGSPQGSEGDTDATAEKSKTPFHSTRMRLPDMEGLPSQEDLSPVSPTDSGGAVIARPPVE